MKNFYSLKHLLIIFTIIFCLGFITISGKTADTISGSEAKNTNLSKSSKKNIVTSSTYFSKGVYLNYALEEKNPSKDFFYVFYDEESGHTDDGTVGIGLPFACKQFNNIVKFSFGGAEPENEDILTIESFNHGIVQGYFDKEEKLIFVPVPNTNPDNFDAQKYLKKHKK